MGLLDALCNLVLSQQKTAEERLLLPDPSPRPWAPSLSQPFSRQVERCHLTMEMGLPFLPAGFWADLKACVPGPENLPYPKSRLKPTAAFQVVPGDCATDTHTRTNFNIKNCLELCASTECTHESIFTDFTSQPQKVVFALSTNFIKFINERKNGAEEEEI